MDVNLVIQYSELQLREGFKKQDQKDFINLPLCRPKLSGKVKV